MRRSIPNYYLGYALIAGLLLGVALANLGLGSDKTPVVAMDGDATMNMTMDMPDMAQMDHGHEPYPVAEGPIPEISLSASLDPESGWNLLIETQHFEFRPARFGADISANFGHAHLYINGEKVSRLYGPHVHLSTLKPGVNEVRVSLNTDDHKTLFYEGEPIEASITLAN